MIDFTKLREKLDPDPGGEDQLRIRTGVVVTDNADGTVDITLSGVLVPGVPKLADAGTILAAGATVQVLTLRGGSLILGASAGTAGQGARKVSAFNANNPSGITSTSYTALTGGDILGVAFVAPPSGSVEITLEGWLGLLSTTLGSRMWMSGSVATGAVVNAGSVVNAAIDTQAAVFENGSSFTSYRYGYVNTTYPVTGLTPGSSYNVTVNHKVSNLPSTGGAVFNRRVLVRPW